MEKYKFPGVNEVGPSSPQFSQKRFENPNWDHHFHIHSPDPCVLFLYRVCYFCISAFKFLNFCWRDAVVMAGRRDSNPFDDEEVNPFAVIHVCSNVIDSRPFLICYREWWIVVWFLSKCEWDNAMLVFVVACIVRSVFFYLTLCSLIKFLLWTIENNR